MSLISMALGRRQIQIHGQSKTAALNLCCGNHSFGSFVSKVSYTFLCGLKIGMKTTETKSLTACLCPYLWNARGTERNLHGVSYSLSEISNTDMALFARGFAETTTLGKQRIGDGSSPKKTGRSKDSKSHSECHKLFQSSIQINFGNFCNFLKARYTKLLVVATKFNLLSINSCPIQGLSSNGVRVVSNCTTAVKDIKVRRHIKV
jgi:hypothetical protein